MGFFRLGNICFYGFGPSEPTHPSDPFMPMMFLVRSTSTSTLDWHSSIRIITERERERACYYKPYKNVMMGRMEYRYPKK